MKKKFKLIFIVGLIVLGFIGFSMITFITPVNRYSVVKRFGRIERVVDTAGLSVKAPIIDSVSYIPKSIQFYDLPKSQVITSDKKSMILDAYILWKVTDPKLFTKALNASTSTAEGRINIIVYNAIKTTISAMTQEELIVSRDDDIVVSNHDAKPEDLEINDYESDEVVNLGDARVMSLTEKLLDCVGTQEEAYGVEVLDVQVKVLDLPDENKAAVYNRMITERNNIAAAYKAQGESEAQIIRNTTDAEVEVMLSEAKATAESTVADGEKEYMKILADAYNDEKKADFYTYSLSLDTAKTSLKKDTTLFIDKDSPIAKIFTQVK